MTTRTIELDQKDLDRNIDVLSSAAQALQLTRFESRSYRVLMLSVDAALVSLFVGILFGIFQVVWGVGVCTLVFFVSILTGMASLALNIPLFVRIFRETERLKKLGLNSLSKSLWIESRRSRWLSRARGWLLVGIAIYLVFATVGALLGLLPEPREERTVILVLALFFLIIAGLLFAARYLRNQRERMDLTANAEELKKALQSLRQRAGDAEVVTIPSELLEQTAKIETVQIARERKDAVLRSIDSPSEGYVVAFDRGAVEQRGTLGIADRVELEDLVEQLSGEAAEQASQAGPVDGATATLRGATKSKRVEIDYVIDQASRRIHIIAVRQTSGSSPTSPIGASHA